MRGPDHKQSSLFSYTQIEDRIAADHPLRRIKVMADMVLQKKGYLNTCPAGVGLHKQHAIRNRVMFVQSCLCFPAADKPEASKSETEKSKGGRFGDAGCASSRRCGCPLAAITHIRHAFDKPTVDRSIHVTIGHEACVVTVQHLLIVAVMRNGEG